MRPACHDWIAPGGGGGGRIGEEFVDGGAKVTRDLVETLVAFVGLDPAGGHEDVLRRCAHLPRVQAQRKGQVAQHGLVLVGRFDDDVVDAGQPGDSEPARMVDRQCRSWCCR
jgi:hypothetical protein